ncbi:MAG: hypothetical protein C0501_19135 [Isosphaera sp.]|nr:hypothetical protein [Isosphaera sp.]
MAAVAAGAGAAWGQEPAPLGPPPGAVVPAQGPAPTLMPPVRFGPEGDPLGFGPTATLGPPPGPMYPTPGPYAAPLFQPPPPGQGGRDFGYGAAPRIYFDASYVLAFVRDQPINYPLLTTGSPNQMGVLGQNTTIALIPARDIDYGAVSGYRLGGGFYGDADRRFGFDITALSLGERRFTQTFRGDSVGSVGVPVLARPFINANTGLQTSQVLISPTIPGAVPANLPNVVTTGGGPFMGTGTVITSTPADTTVVPGVTSPVSSTAVGGVKFLATTEVFSIDPSALWNIFRSTPGTRAWMSVDALVGYRYLEVQERIRISSQSALTGVLLVQTVNDPAGPAGPMLTGSTLIPIPVAAGGVAASAPATISITDRFNASNQFNGGNFGLRGEVRYGVCDLSVTGKVAVGTMHQELRVRGLTAFTNPLSNTSGFSLSGLYANSSNIGTFTRDEFTVIPEVNLNIGVNVTRGFRMFLGYNFLHVENVIRPGNELNPVINPAVVPFNTAFGLPVGTPGPGPAFNNSSYWVHAANFGFSFRY